MGRTFLFECPKCQYSARVSGGEDRGWNVSIRTIHCLDCRSLYDAIVSVRSTASLTPAIKRQVPTRPPRFEATLNRLPGNGGRRMAWLDYPLACPVSAQHRVREWKPPGKCPRCGVFMEQNGLPFRLWD